MCKQKDAPSLRVLSTEQQKMVFLKRGILLSSGSRCCKDHLYNNHLSYEALQRITSTQMDMAPFDTNSTIQLLTDCFAIMQNVKAFDFDDPMLLSEEPYYNMTGLKKGM